MIDLTHPLAVEDDDSYDPFAAFDKFMGAGHVSTALYPAYAELRSKCPVHSTGELFARLGAGGGSAKALGMAVFTNRGVEEVLRDRDGFSVQIPNNFKKQLFGDTMMDMDEPEHMQLRMLVAKAFNPKAVDSYGERLVKPIVKRLIDAFADRGRADLVAEFTFIFPVYVIAGMLGLPEEDLPLFHRRAVEIIAPIDMQRSLRASKRLADYFARIIAQRRAEPREDLATDLVNARLDGRALTETEIIDFLRLLLPAGAETTYRSTSNLLFALLRHPDQLAAVAADRSLIPQAFEEALRWEAPITLIPRQPLRDAKIDGVDVPAGTTLGLCIASTNRDPAQHERPDQFDIFRQAKPHLAFGRGNHMCLGQHLARMETRIAINALLDRLPGLRLDPDAKPVEIEGAIFRAPPKLPVVWDV